MATADDAPIYLTSTGRRRLEQRLQDYTAQLRRLQPSSPPDETPDRGDQAVRLEAADDVARLTDLITALQDLLNTAVPLPEGPDDGTIRLGSTATVRDDEGAEHRFTLLDGAEVGDDPDEVSLDSPVGRALLSRVAGDEVTVRLPRGERRFAVTAVDPYRPQTA